MSRITSWQLRQKDVINLCDGTKLGCVSEIEFDTCRGQICSLMLTAGDGIFNFMKGCKIVIPWSRIECIGEDAILVKITASEREDYFKSLKKKMHTESE